MRTQAPLLALALSLVWSDGQERCNLARDSCNGLVTLEMKQGASSTSLCALAVLSSALNMVTATLDREQQSLSREHHPTP